ncbi:MAG: potassium-transporting ATPase subunit [Solirubrobacteraceae bacterium]|nr:potassium-transporting ATPase subunit [Solirubrobacteraceae bacterium]
MRRDLITSVRAVVVLTVLCGLIYPLAVWVVGQAAFPGRADGSQIHVNGKLVGSRLLGQDFSRPVLGRNGRPKKDSDGNPVTEPDPMYFQERPSQDAYNAAGTFFSNRGPNQKSAVVFYRAELAGYLALEHPYDPGLTKAGVPVDAVTTSGSGVDPDISQTNARIQAHRIAVVRRVSLTRVDQLIAQHTDGRFLGLLGEPGVNVLELNLALDKEAPHQ